jgi:hypothetical protein
VCKPLLDALDIEWSEFRQRKPERRSISTPALP